MHAEDAVLWVRRAENGRRCFVKPGPDGPVPAGDLPAPFRYSGAFANVAALKNSMPVKDSLPSTQASWPGGMV